MSTLAALDQCVVVRNMPWSQFEAFLALKGEESGPRVAYLDGDLSLMTPSQDHEFLKKNLGRLVEAYCEETGAHFWSFGSWTLKQRRLRAGAEPDECFIVGERGTKKVPDLAIEVLRSHGGLDKQEIYRRLGVPELWFFESGAISVLVLKAGRYRAAKRSALFPGLDLTLVARLARHDDPLAALKKFRQSVRGKDRR